MTKCKHGKVLLESFTLVPSIDVICGTCYEEQESAEFAQKINELIEDLEKLFPSS